MRSALLWLLPRLGVAFPLALGLAVALYLLVLPEVVWQLYRAELRADALQPPEIGRGAGSAAITYLAMTYDCRHGDARIEGPAPQAAYWMIGLYDLYARAVDGGHLDHSTAPVGPDGRFQVRITRQPEGAPGTLDCSRAPRGMVLLRVVRPESEVEVPTVVLQRPR